MTLFVSIYRYMFRSGWYLCLYHSYCSYWICEIQIPSISLYDSPAHFKCVVFYSKVEFTSIGPEEICLWEHLCVIVPLVCSPTNADRTNEYTRACAGNSICFAHRGRIWIESYWENVLVFGRHPLVSHLNLTDSVGYSWFGFSAINADCCAWFRMRSEATNTGEAHLCIITSS